MGPGRQKRAPSAKRLGILAMRFRGTRDGAERTAIARAYSETVARLIGSKKWRDMPPLEDQLPDEWMPKEFFAFWSLSPPPRGNGAGRDFGDGSCGLERGRNT